MPTSADIAAECVQVFTDFDKDGSGSIDRSELKLAFAALGVMLKESEIKAMMEEADEEAAEKQWRHHGRDGRLRSLRQGRPHSQYDATAHSVTLKT